MKLKKLLSAALFAIIVFLLAISFDMQMLDHSEDSCANNEYGFIYDDDKNDFEDLINDQILIFSCVDNSPNFCIQKNFNQNYVYARKSQQDKSSIFNGYFLDEFIGKLAGLSRFNLTFAALQSKHVLCYIYLFCRILT